MFRLTTNSEDKVIVVTFAIITAVVNILLRGWLVMLGVGMLYHAGVLAGTLPFGWSMLTGWILMVLAHSESNE